MAKKRMHVIVEGRVQGVFFRAYTKDKADELLLGGWVRNLADGRVETCIEGETDSVQRMLEWLAQGSPQAIVIRTLQRELPLSEGSSPFTILPTAAQPMTGNDQP